jgi:uncharacterized glyoxalase superfamily protein PhnB
VYAEFRPGGRSGRRRCVGRQKAIEFYQRLGLQFPEDPDPMGHGHVEAPLQGGLRFTLDTEESIRSFDPIWAPPSGGHRVAVAFRCESPDDADRLYRELTDADAPSYKEPWEAFWGQRYAQVKGSGRHRD